MKTRRWVTIFSATLLATGIAYAQGAEVKAQGSQESKASAQHKKEGTKASADQSMHAAASAQAGQNSAMLESGTIFHAELSKEVDAKKNKPGDRVEAKTTEDVKSGGQVILPKGSRLIGRVTKAQARSKEQSESVLGIAFDHAVLKNGQEVPVNLAIQAVAASRAAFAASQPESNTMATGSGTSQASAGAGGLVSGVGSTAGAAASTAGGVTGAAGSTLGATSGTAASLAGAAQVDAAGRLISSSQGVAGLAGLSLNSQSESATAGSLFVSSTRNVRLDSGTQLILRATASGQ